MTVFYGREAELHRLLEAQQLSDSKLFVITGRRRIGKSSLIEKFGENQKAIFKEKNLWVDFPGRRFALG